MRKYLKADFYRMVTSKYFLLGIGGVALTFLLGAHQFGRITDAYMSYFYNSYACTMIISYAFCAVSFSGCLIEDSENKYWIHCIQKGNISKYVWSKVIMLLLSGVITMVLGVLAYAFFLRIRVPFFIENITVIGQRTQDSFGFILYEDTILLYFICTAALGGLLGGIFAVTAAFVSLYEKSRMITVCIPVVGFYFLQNIVLTRFTLPNCFDVWYIYGLGYSLFENTWLHISYAVAIAIVYGIILGCMIKRKIWRNIYGNDDKARLG